MAKSKEYWNKRFEALELAQIEKGAAYFAELEKQYKQAARQVQNDINKWYARFANNNEITLQEARKLLTANELEEFKWDVMEYIEKGRDNAVSEQWMKQLENASAKWHISRLEALKVQMQNHVEVLYGNEQDSIADLMSDIYTDGYYHTAYEIQKGFNIGYDLMKLDTDKVEKLISKPWAADGSNFSDRIWKQKSQLVSELHNNMTQSIVTGKNPAKVTDEIAKRFDVSKGQAGRLVMTETAFFASASTKDAFNELDVEQYEILATLDTKTSDTCRELDGKVFKMSEYEVGVTAPPFHVWCRTTTVPYFDDEFELGSKRAARNEDGETYYVPSDMKYSEWEDKFINGGSKKDLKFVQEELDLEQEDRVRLDAQKINDDETWIPKKTSSMVRDPANFGKQVESDNIPVVVEDDDDMDMFEDIVMFHPATSKAEAVEFAKTLTINGEFEADGIHLNTVNGFNEAMFNVEQRFGNKLNIAGVKAVKTADAKYHQGSYDPITKFVSLKGGNSANALTTYKANAEKFFKNGWNASSDVYGTFYHEIGHSVWDDLSATAKNEIRDIYKNTKHSAYEKWMAMGGSRSGYSQAEVFGKELSRYALENEEEFFSEAFSQIMSGRARPVSREVKDILDKYYKVADDVVEAPKEVKKAVQLKVAADDVIKEPLENTVKNGTIELQETISDTTYFKYATNVEYSKLTKQHSKNVSKDDKKQIQKHVKDNGSPGGYVATHNYSNINSIMRDDGFSISKSLDEDDVKTIEAMRRAISQNALDDDYVLTRYVNADYLSSVFDVKGAINRHSDLEPLSNMFVELANPYVRNNEIPRITKELQKQVGKRIKEKAFISTSFIRDKNIMKNKAVLFEFHAPKGTHAYIPQNRKESECLLADGTEYLIEKIEYSELVRKWIITAKIL